MIGSLSHQAPWYLIGPCFGLVLVACSHSPTCAWASSGAGRTSSSAAGTGALEAVLGSTTGIAIFVALVVAGSLVGGFLLSWSRLTEPEVIRSSLALENLYVLGVMGLAVATGFVGIRAARRFLRVAVLTGEPIAWSTQKPEFRHVAGSVVFGLGWALSDVALVTASAPE